MPLSKENIFSKDTLKQEIINIPEWDGEIIVSEMSGLSREEWERSLQEKDANGRVVCSAAKLLVATVVDENGNRIFSEADIPKINKLSSRAIEKVCQAALRINGLLAESIEQARGN